jgi:2-polyprenyl-3-methyl-5-hydroxy-6-metoxy-1,4-benzoquinol methylase
MNTATVLPKPFAKLVRTAVLQAGQFGPTPPVRVLSPIRRAALPGILSAHAAGDRSELADVAEEALAAMRSDVDERARSGGLLASAFARGDIRWRDCDADELLDDPELDPGLRSSIMSTLDYFNELVDSYERFFDALLPLARPGKTTRVLDLAAGHGGFCLAAARIAAERGLDFSFTASDLKREYLDMGEERARRDGLDVDFVVQDALDLSNLAPDSYDIVICTQSLHHFPAGLVAVMFEAASRAASRGVVFIDGCRSVLSAATTAMFGGLGMRNAGFVHDGWISMRKCFVPEELELLARLGRADGELESVWMPPNHCLLRWTRPER